VKSTKHAQRNLRWERKDRAWFNPPGDE